MTAMLKVTVDGSDEGTELREELAFCAPTGNGYAAIAANRSPEIAWSGAPPGAASYAIICRDSDNPLLAGEVDKKALSIAADEARADFYHWVLVDIPAGMTGLAEGADSDGVTGGGKEPGLTDHGVRGLNDFTKRFAEVEQLNGAYGGYDGPWPPANDALAHRYHFTVYALDVPSLELKGTFGAPEALAAMAGHILCQGEWVGTYTLNAELRAH